MDERVFAVQRMQDYIEAHLEEDITLSDLAAAARFSPWYAHRLFLKETGESPAAYIRKLRLSTAARSLKDGKTVLDAALSVGFDSADGFTRAFRREFGMNPISYAKDPVPICLFIPYGVKFREKRKEIHHMENLQSVFIQTVQKPERKCIIKRGIKADNYFDYCGEVGCDVWGLLTSMDSLSGEPVCMFLPQKYIKPGTSSYVMGVEEAPDYAGKIPEGFEIIEMPETTYLMFQGEPFEEENYCEAIEALHFAIDRYDPSVIGYAWDKQEPRIQLEPIGTRGYIELLPVKRA